MHVLIIADMEGVSGIGHMDACQPSSPAYGPGVQLLTHEVNALAGAAFDAGATSSSVIDWHAGGGNLPPELLDRRLTLAEEDLTVGYDVAVLSGFHAMHGDPQGFISHTMYRGTSVEIDGRTVGELWLLSRWAGMHDIPVALVSGDQAAAEEAKRDLPGTPAVAVKTARSFSEADVLPAEEARQHLAGTLAHALRSPERWRTYRYSQPIRFRLGFDHDEELPRQPRPNLQRDHHGRLCGQVSNPHELITVIDEIAAMRKPRA